MEQIESLLKRPALYGNIDGVMELGMGFMLLGFSILIWFQAHSSADSIWHNMWAFMGYVILMSLALHFGMKAIKERLTYHRTGFVSYRKSKLVWGFAIAFAVAAITAVAAFCLAKIGSEPAFAFFLVVSIAFASTYAYRTAFAVHWKWIVVAAMMAAAVITAFLPGPFLESLGGTAVQATLFGAFLLYFFLMSVVFLISGGISLFIYVRNTPMPRPEIR
jgi:hypothetical protein